MLITMHNCHVQHGTEQLW